MRLLLLLMLPFTPVCAQNYVMNGSFERLPPSTGKLTPEVKPCTFAGGPDVFNLTVDNWHTYKLVTPDIFLIDTTKTCDKALPRPHTGTKMTGLIMYLPGTDGDHEYDYHEYIEGKLAKPLTPGKRYQVSFWVKEGKQPGANHLRGLGEGTMVPQPVNCGNFGFYFATQPSNDREDIRMSIFDYGLKPQVNFKEVVATGDGWLKMSMVFVPDQAFRYFIFGNFFSDGITPNDMSAEKHAEIDASNAKQPEKWKRRVRIGYYLFDDFAVIEAPEAAKEPVGKPSFIAEKLMKDKKITLSATLLFEVDKAMLKPEASTELDAIVGALTTNPGIKIEIGGHTDNTGTTAHNRDLSERRAVAVRDYLVAHGVDLQRLITKGYAETVPVADNATPEGRSANRRVECKVMQ